MARRFALLTVLVLLTAGERHAGSSGRPSAWGFGHADARTQRRKGPAGLALLVDA